MNKFALFYLTLITLVFLGCAHQTKPDAYEPKHIFEEEENSGDYVMLTDEDVNITEEDTTETESTASGP